jgi:IS30 family transposase
MANHLKMALVHSILTLSTQGWSQRRIARELGVDRETVSRHIRRVAARANPANAPPGSEVSDVVACC